VTTIKPASLDELKTYVLKRKPDFEQFKLRGPYAVTVHKDRELRLSATRAHRCGPVSVGIARARTAGDPAAWPGQLEADPWLPGPAPGQLGHAQPVPAAANNGPWVTNGHTLARMVKSIHDRPEIIDRRIDPQRIVLAGHSSAEPR